MPPPPCRRDTFAGNPELASFGLPRLALLLSPEGVVGVAEVRLPHLPRRRSGWAFPAPAGRPRATWLILPVAYACLKD